MKVDCAKLPSLLSDKDWGTCVCYTGRKCLPKLTMTKVCKRKGKFRNDIFKFYDSTPSKYVNTLCPTNLDEQKELFLQNRTAPSFVFNSVEKVESAVKQQKGKIRHHLYREAVRILEITREKYGNGDGFLDAAFGPPIDEKTATSLLTNYIRANHVEGAFKILFTKDLSSSARMMWHGPNIKCNKPEARKYTMFIRNTPDNRYMRMKGIRCLAEHEIGTHFFRMMNDGLQPWFSDRKKFGLRPLKSEELGQTEEGLATINTVLFSNAQYLKVAALSYYAACKAKDMTFRELFDHLAVYVLSPETRWRMVMRVKRGLPNPNDVGGYGGDQCYFEGAVKILRNIDSIDFYLLYSGKLCVDELHRVRRVARLDCIRSPRFLKDVEKYKRKLKKIAILNKLLPGKTMERARTELRPSAFGDRKVDSSMSLRAETCLALYQTPPVNQDIGAMLSKSSISIDGPDYTKDPDSGFVYITPTPSIHSFLSLDVTHSPSLSSKQALPHKINGKSLLKRPKTVPNKLKKHRTPRRKKNGCST